MSVPLLPPIDPFGRRLTQKVLQTIQVEKNHSNKHHHLKMKPTSKQPSPIQTQVDASKYRHSLFHNICIQMLKEGFHIAFREFFNLLGNNTYNNNDNETIEFLRQCPEKLTYIKDQLIAIERGERCGDVAKVFDEQHALSRFFEELGNIALAHRFCLAMFENSKNTGCDDRKKNAIAEYHLGRFGEQNKDYVQAHKFYQSCYELAEGKTEWKHDNGDDICDEAGTRLISVLINLSDNVEREDKVVALDHLHKAYDLMKLSKSKKITNVGYLLGNKYDIFGDYEKAVQYLTEYLEACTVEGDTLGMGRAYQALSFAHHNNGQNEEAAEYLKMLISITNLCGDRELLREGCSDLAALYTQMGRYIESCKYSKQSFELSRGQSKNGDAECDVARCEYGISLAHGLFGSEVNNITSNTKLKSTKLFEWREERLLFMQ